MVPTPTLALSARDFDAAVMITASHNPPEYNGIKLLNPDGSAFSPEQQKELEQSINDKNLMVAAWEHMQNQEEFPAAVRKHVAHIRGFFPERYPVKIVVDCAGAAACVITPALLEEMGCEVIRLNCHPTGRFPHPVEPIMEHLSELIEMVKTLKADLGIAHDGDADRMMAVDDRGQFISGDKMFRLIADELQARNVVTTIDASMTIEKKGYFVMRTAVGDNNVCEELKKNNYQFGGEPSGAWIFPKSTLCPDGIFAAAVITSIAAKSRLSALVDALPDYPIYRNSFPIDGINLPQLADRVTAKIRPISISWIDGIKFVYDDAWFLIRPSGTEPKIRLTIEASSPARLDEVKGLLTEMISGRS
jgi:phosphoglucosamine mutase